MSNLIDQQELLNYCDANISMTQKNINEWLEHTIEYKKTHDYIIPLRERLRVLEDFKRFIIELAKENDESEPTV